MKNIMKVILVILTLILLFMLYLIFFYKAEVSIESWYNHNKYIGHAFYGIDGFSYTNSIEALEYGYSKGIRVMETDLMYTSDNRIVVNHYWDQQGVLTYSEFMNKKIYDKYSPMDLDMLIGYMIKYDDLYIVIDTKENEYSYANYIKIYNELIETIKKRDTRLLDRIIIQIYDYDMYYRIKEIHSFDNYIFSVYKIDSFNVVELVYFCIYNNIDVIGLPEWLIENGVIKDYYIKLIKSKDLKIYSYTVNDKDRYQKYLGMGIDGIYTDYLY